MFSLSLSLSFSASQMFIQVAKEVGGTCNLAPIQCLDLLVRDWQLSGAYGADAGQEYLGEITQDLEVSAEQPLVLEALRASGTRCYLLPHPGTQFTRSRAGTPDDMDEDFRQYLCDYVTSVVHSAGTHVRMERAGQVPTGAQLAARIKGVSRYRKTQRYDFSSPMKMAEAFAVMRQELNRRAVEATRREYEQFVQELDRDHQSMSSCLRVKPVEMQRRLEGKRQELLERCRGELRGEDPQKQAALEELKKELDKQMAEFLPRYEQRFKMAEMAEMREKANRGAVEAARREYGLFVKQLDRGHQSMSSCLIVKPLEMKRRQEGKRQELLKRCRGELRGEDPQKQAALEELKQELGKQMDQFLSSYGQHFKVKKAEWLGLYIGPSPAASACRTWARPHWPVHLPISKRLRPIGCPFRRWDGGSKGFWDL
ncbi:RING finger protein 112-like [Chrysemys picta bellii]|uniref:RING finger protein 112-like n=1 Tax=Chrysemys picta bellii TaxID=8478 RepID=UPI0032B16693